MILGQKFDRPIRITSLFNVPRKDLVPRFTRLPNINAILGFDEKLCQ